MTALLEVRDLAKTFEVSAPWLNRVIERRPRLFVHAVDGVSFSIEFIDSRARRLTSSIGKPGFARWRGAASCCRSANRNLGGAQ